MWFMVLKALEKLIQLDSLDMIHLIRKQESPECSQE